MSKAFRDRRLYILLFAGLLLFNEQIFSFIIVQNLAIARTTLILFLFFWLYCWAYRIPILDNNSSRALTVLGLLLGLVWFAFPITMDKLHHIQSLQMVTDMNCKMIENMETNGVDANIFNRFSTSIYGQNTDLFMIDVKDAATMSLGLDSQKILDSINNLLDAKENSIVSGTPEQLFFNNEVLRRLPAAHREVCATLEPFLLAKTSDWLVSLPNALLQLVTSFF